MINSNNNFNKKYDLKFYFNDNVINELTVQDVFLSQRVIKKRTIRKNILKIGKNNFKYTLINKNGNEVKNVKLNILVTMTTNHTYDKILKFENRNIEKFDIIKKGYWNITGTIEAGDDKGYFFIKTNN